MVTARLHVREWYQNIHMAQPLEPGVYPWKDVDPTAIRPMLEHGKAVWVGKPPKEFLQAEGNDEDDLDQDPVPDAPDFFEMNVGELRDYAATHQIAIPGSVKKRDDIVAILEAHYAASLKTGDGDDVGDDDQDEGESDD